MKLAIFLHLYQPPTQSPDVLYKISQQSYKPIISILEANPGAKMTLNISGSLVEQMMISQGDILEKIKNLVRRGQIELTGSAIYHPLLTEIPDFEISRQIELNSQILKNQLDNAPLKAGFFAPEMSIDNRICQILKEMGYEYVLADESVLPEGEAKLLNQTRIFIDKQSGLKIVCRNKQLSLDIAFSRIRTVSDFLERAKNWPYVILAMDGETFGHHHPEQMELLRTLFQYYVISKEIELITVSNLLSTEAPVEIYVQKSSWAESFNRWRNPNNPLHQSQWKLLDLAVKTLETSAESGETFVQARALLDKGLHSDQFWWSSYSPCWHYKMMEKGARLLLDSVLSLSTDLPAKKQAQDLYDEITKTGLKMYGDTVIGC